MKYAILGAGLTGLSLAKLLSNDNHEVTLYEKNENEIGGMCFELQEKDVKYSKYGPHIFHTNNEEVWKFINENCEMINYRHIAKSQTSKGIMDWPINYNVIKQVYETDDLEHALDLWKIDIMKDGIGLDEDNFENKAIKNVGKKLYDLFIKRYTTTQWGTDPKNLPSELFGRVRIEKSYKEDFFSDKYVALAKNGFNELCYNLLKNSKIVYKKITYKDLDKLKQKHDCIISTIPPWILLHKEPLDMIKIEFKELSNTLVFSHTMRFNKISVLNLCDNINMTRITNYGELYKHINKSDKFIAEVPGEFGVPLYPIRLKANIDKAQEMIDELKEKHNIISIGRLGSYKYINMDQAIEQSIETYKMLKGEIQ